MESRKQAILDALDAFVRQRAGLEFGNYGDVKSYRAEARSITRDLHRYRAIRAEVGQHESLTADMLLEASRSAFSGRLTLKDIRATYDDGSIYHKFSVSYCAGQYMPTEYRKAACAVLASALWYWTREHAMPSAIVKDGEKTYPHAGGRRNNVSAGDWLRAHFRRLFGRGIADGYFN